MPDDAKRGGEADTVHHEHPPFAPPCRWLQTHTIWSVQCPVQPWCFNKSFSSHLCGLLSHSAIVTTGWRGFHHTCEVNTWSAHIVFNETQRTTARKSFLTTPLFLITETKLLVTIKLQLQIFSTCLGCIKVHLAGLSSGIVSTYRGAYKLWKLHEQFPKQSLDCF